MTADELAEMFVPVPMRWRKIVAGDVIVGRDGKLWTVEQVPPSYVLRSGAQRYPEPGTPRVPVDPDDVATVLLPTGLRDAMQLTRDELGAQLLVRSGAA